MLLPLPAFTDSLPVDFTLGMTGGVSLGSATEYEFRPYLHDMLGGFVVGADSAVSAVSQESMLGGLALGGDSTLAFESPLTLEHYMEGGLAIGGGASFEFDGTVILGLALGAQTLVSFSEPVVYDLVDEGVPAGGVEVGGAGVVLEAIPVLPTGGVVVAGGATVLEVIPVLPTGGVVAGGSAPIIYASSVVPSGGIVVAGEAPTIVRYAFVAAGGMVVAGDALISDRQALHVPEGGVLVGGTALAYSLAARYPATTANPYARPYPGWAMNLNSGASSRYLRLPANSVCHFNGVDYVANEGGIYSLDGQTDDGRAIAAGIQLPQTEYGTPNNKQVEAMYVAARASGKLRLSVSTNNGATAHYALAPDPEKMSAVRVKTARGLVGRYWTWRLDNEDGSDFELQSLSHQPDVLARHGR